MALLKKVMDTEVTPYRAQMESERATDGGVASTTAAAVSDALDELLDKDLSGRADGKPSGDCECECGSECDGGGGSVMVSESVVASAGGAIADVPMGGCGSANGGG